MAYLFGKKRSREELLRHTGDLEQICGIREYAYTEGRAAGVKALEVNNGCLRFEILPSRCLDISFASHQGYPFAYMSKSKIRHPSYFTPGADSAFLDNFFGGVLTTCGFGNIGAAVEENGKRHGLHGELANIPADRYACSCDWEGDDYRLTVSGEIRHSRFYGEDLRLRRSYSTLAGASSFTLEDLVENCDFAPSPCLFLYHVNFGFPFFSAASRLLYPETLATEIRPGSSAAKAAAYQSFTAPRDSAPEYCLYHRFRPDDQGFVTVCLFNPELGAKGLGVYLRYDATVFPVFVQWTMERSREYVCGFAPATAKLENRDPAETEKTLLQPLAKQVFRSEIGVVEGERACETLLAGNKER